MYQVACLARQVFPGQSKAMVEAYQDCMLKQFGYLVVDLSPHAEEDHRLRTNIFKDEVTIIYKTINRGDCIPLKSIWIMFN